MMNSNSLVEHRIYRTICPYCSMTGRYHGINSEKPVMRTKDEEGWKCLTCGLKAPKVVWRALLNNFEPRNTIEKFQKDISNITPKQLTDVIIDLEKRVKLYYLIISKFGQMTTEKLDFIYHKYCIEIMRKYNRGFLIMERTSSINYCKTSTDVINLYHNIFSINENEVSIIKNVDLGITNYINDFVENLNEESFDMSEESVLKGLRF